MDRVKRLRRVAMLMAGFARNLAYFRELVGRRERFPKTAAFDFWMTLSNNTLDVAVLEWCKLFADEKDRHHWINIVTKPKDFERELLEAVGLTEDAFAHYRKAMRHYRDKFVAHLDSDEVMDIPLLDTAEAAVRYYHAHLVTKEIGDHLELRGLPSSPIALATYFKEQSRVASLIYERALPPVAAEAL